MTWYGRSRTGFVNLPAYLMGDLSNDSQDVSAAGQIFNLSKTTVEESKLQGSRK